MAHMFDTLRGQMEAMEKATAETRTAFESAREAFESARKAFKRAQRAEAQFKQRLEDLANDPKSGNGASGSANVPAETPKRSKVGRGQPKPRPIARRGLQGGGNRKQGKGSVLQVSQLEVKVVAGKHDECMVKAARDGADFQRAAGAASQPGAEHDARMSESEGDDDEALDLEFEAIVARLQRKFSFFGERCLDPLPRYYLTELYRDWSCMEQEDKIAWFRDLLASDVTTMAELNEKIKDFFYKELSEPCHFDGKWHADVINAFDRWNEQYPFSVSLDKFTDDSWLHKCTVYYFKMVEKNVNEQFTSESCKSWREFANAILRQCFIHPGPLDSREYEDEYEFDEYIRDESPAEA